MTTQLVGIRVDSYKRLELVNVEFPPSGGVVAIMGDNEAGKTSLLDALETTIAGKKMPKSAQPVHVGKGAEKARIVATFDDIEVTRVFRKDGGTTIAVKGRDGVNVSDPAKLLERLYSHVALDPLAFSRLGDAEQVNTLLPLIGYDPAPLDAERKETYDLRTVKGRDVAALRNRLAAFPDPAPGLPKEEISIAKLSEELSARERHNANLVQHGMEVSRRAADVTVKEALVESLRAQLAAAEEALATARASLAEGQAEGENIEIANVDEIREQIENAEAANAAVRAEASRQAVAAELATAEREHGELSTKIEEIEGRKAKALAAAVSKMPFPGLTVSDDDDPILLLNGIPFSQASTGVKIKTGTAVAMALNPSLRLIVIRDASLLDQGNRDVIDQLAKDNGFLVLMEIADESSPVGVIIEEGLVREIRTANETEEGTK